MTKPDYPVKVHGIPVTCQQCGRHVPVFIFYLATEKERTTMDYKHDSGIQSEAVDGHYCRSCIESFKKSEFE